MVTNIFPFWYLFSSSQAFGMIIALYSLVNLTKELAIMLCEISVFNCMQF